ncbi:MAG: PQQ-binding-like beta-propeller repeat protein [Acidobacteria bacterium]|nr:PQQ-binding-like beta-propeller repeat protein [Acidobacteriota bacterium]
MTVVACLILLALAIPTAGQEQWPKFRGPAAGAVPDDPSLPEQWSETENVVWKTAIPGLGWSSPVVWDDHVFLTSAVSAGQEEVPVPGLYDEHDHISANATHRWVVYDVDFETGAIRWERELHREFPELRRHIKNSYASETPVTDGELLYIYFGSLGLVAAFDLDGAEVWRTEIGVFNTLIELGTAASPVLHGDRLFIVNDNTTASFMIAMDKRTGEELWRVSRDERGNNWSTPVVWENRVRTEIVTTGSDGVRSYDLDGGLLWELKGMSNLTTPSPFVAEGLVYISSGYPGGALRPVYAIHPGASGDISLWAEDTDTWSTRFPGNRASSEYIAWAYPLLGTYTTTALVYRGIYYTLLDRGLLIAHNARTGAEVYGRQRIRVGSGFTASPWGYNGKVFLLSEAGDTYVIKAGPEFEILGTNPLNEMTLATPAVVRGSLLIRTQSALYRIARTAEQ